jgi:AraC-like DNA-binding protein
VEYILLPAPAYPFFIYAGDALYRPGDFHRQRSQFDVFDVLFIETGCLYMQENKRKYELRENCVLVLQPKNTHRSYSLCDQRTYFHWLHFDTTEEFKTSSAFPANPKQSVDFLNKTGQQETLILPVFQQLSEHTASHVFQLLKQLESLTINRYHQISMVPKATGIHSDRLHQQSLFLELLSLITLNKDMSASNQTAYLVMQFIQANYNRQITLHDMVSVANCHPTHIIRCFRKEYDTTPIKALSEIRLEKAKNLLISTELPCEVIAEQVGFASSSYFSKSFRERHGLSPQNYRQKQRAE